MSAGWVVAAMALLALAHAGWQLYLAFREVTRLEGRLAALERLRTSDQQTRLQEYRGHTQEVLDLKAEDEARRKAIRAERVLVETRHQEQLTTLIGLVREVLATPAPTPQGSVLRAHEFERRIAGWLREVAPGASQEEVAAESRRLAGQLGPVALTGRDE